MKLYLVLLLAVSVTLVLTEESGLAEPRSGKGRNKSGANRQEVASSGPKEGRGFGRRNGPEQRRSGADRQRQAAVEASGAREGRRSGRRNGPVQRRQRMNEGNVVRPSGLPRTSGRKGSQNRQEKVQAHALRAKKRDSSEEPRSERRQERAERRQERAERTQERRNKLKLRMATFNEKDADVNGMASSEKEVKVRRTGTEKPDLFSRRRNKHAERSEAPESEDPTEARSRRTRTNPFSRRRNKHAERSETPESEAPKSEEQKQPAVEEPATSVESE